MWRAKNTRPCGYFIFTEPCCDIGAQLVQHSESGQVAAHAFPAHLAVAEAVAEVEGLLLGKLDVVDCWDGAVDDDDALPQGRVLQAPGKCMVYAVPVVAAVGAVVLVGPTAAAAAAQILPAAACTA